MRRIVIHYGCGYGSHTTDLEFPDDATEEEIKQDVRDFANERFWWSHEDGEDGE